MIDVKDTEVDVVIVGGGLAGLSTTYAMDLLSKHQHEQGQPVPAVVLLEADESLGGRTSTDPDDYSDFGAAYIAGSQQSYTQLLTRELQVSTFPTFLPQDKEWLYQFRNGSLRRFPGNDPLDLPGGIESVNLLGELDAQTAVIRANLFDLTRVPKAKELDSITAADWMDQYLTSDGKPLSEETRDVMTVSIRAALSVEPEDVSFLFLMYYAATAGSYSDLVDINGGPSAAEGTRLTYGTASLVSALTAATTGHEVKARVTSIELVPDGARVTAMQGDIRRVWKARKVIVAMSPSDSAKLTFTPSLDRQFPVTGTARMTLASKMTLGRSIKGFLRFKRPFWRDKGLSGYFLSAAGHEYVKYPLNWTLDNSWDPAADRRNPTLSRARNRFSLMTFMVGASAEYWGGHTISERRIAVIKQLSEAFGSDLTAELIDDGRDYVDATWLPGQKRVGGGPTGVLPPGVLFEHAQALKAPLGPIHFAGTESADEWCGYMNGAIQSGFRAATEVLQALTGGKVPAPTAPATPPRTPPSRATPGHTAKASKAKASKPKASTAKRRTAKASTAKPQAVPARTTKAWTVSARAAKAPAAKVAAVPAVAARDPAAPTND
jgi:monoamine oxidase